MSEERFRAHAWSSGGADTYLITARGKVDRDEVAWMIDQVMAALARGRPIYLLFDLTAYEGISREARQTVGERSRDAIPAAAALFGARFPLRIGAELIFRAAAALSGRSRYFRFFDTEAEARAWLAQRREESGAR